MSTARLMQMAAAGVDAGGDVGTNPDLANASYDNKSFSVSSQATTPTGVQITPNGTKVFVNNYQTGKIYEYNLSTAFDITTATYSNNNITVSAPGIRRNLKFNNDGTVIFYLSASGVKEVPLNTAYTLSGGTGTQTQYSFSSGGLHDLFFKSDGTSLYLARNSDDTVYQFNLSAAFDLSTISNSTTFSTTNADASFSVSSEDSNLRGLGFSPDGSRMIILGDTNNAVYQYTLSTAWDISTASYDSISFSVNSQTSGPEGVGFTSDRTKMYIIGPSNDTIFQYSTGTPASSWTDPDLANASYDSVSFDVSSQATVPLTLVTSDDGSKFYLADTITDKVFQYNLSTPWDVTSMSYSGNSLSISSQDGTPFGLSFKPDGLKLYLLGSNTDTVYQYGLTTAWDISTASYDSVSLDVSGQGTLAQVAKFKTDGTKMYLLGRSTPRIVQYAMSTAWDLSTASDESKSLSVSSQEASPITMFINPIGSAVYILGINNDTVYQYDLGTAWDISTGVYNSNQTFDVSGVADNQYGLNFKSDGSKMYTSALATDRIYQYSTD